MLDTDDDTFRRVMQAASDPQQWTSEQSMAIDTLMALGAVEVLSGGPRPLHRRRRRPERSVRDLWQRVGRHRETRAGGTSMEAAIRLAHDS